MISREHRCIFVHIPRTGGDSIESVLWPGERSEADLWMGFTWEYGNAYQTGGLQHLLATQIRDAVGEAVFDAYFRFTFVRNPWDRAVSQYAYMQRRPDLRDFIGMREDDTFKRYLELIQTREHVQWKPQHEFIYDADGRQLVDFVGRFEHLRDDAAAAFAILGVQAELPHLNASEHEPAAAYYDAESVATVARLYAEDIARFGYSASF